MHWTPSKIQRGPPQHDGVKVESGVFPMATRGVILHPRTQAAASTGGKKFGDPELLDKRPSAARMAPWSATVRMVLEQRW
ncbi:hypothetical protein VTO73DRAFT_9680 [Trametes versicolor]